MPINSFYQKIQNLTTEADKLKELKGTFTEVFSGELGRRKISAKFELKQIPNQFLKRNVPFASLNQIDEELNRLEQIGVLLKEGVQWVGFSSSLLRRKVKQSVCADFP